MPSSPVVPVRIPAGEQQVLVLVPVDRYDVRTRDGVAEVFQAGCLVCSGVPADVVARDAALPPLTGVAVATLAPAALALVAEAWAAEAGRELDDEQDPVRKQALRTAQGQARVLRALAGDLIDAPPTAEDFDAATASGLVTPRRLAPRRDEVRPRATSPLASQHEQGARVCERLSELSGSGLRTLRSRSAFAGVTAVAALVLTGCGSEPGAGDRRCTESSGRVVDDSNCRTYGGGGAGGYYYRYGGSAYSEPGGTYLRGGSITPPQDGSGFYGRSGGGG